MQHRVIASASYRREYLGHLGTTLSFFFEASPAGRYSYLYGGDMNAGTPPEGGFVLSARLPIDRYRA